MDGFGEAFHRVGITQPVVGGGVDVGVGDGVDQVAVIDMPMTIKAGCDFPFAVGVFGIGEDITDVLLIFDASRVGERLVGEDESGEI